MRWLDDITDSMDRKEFEQALGVGDGQGPWDFPGKSTGVGCHCLLWDVAERPCFPNIEQR